MRTGRLSLVAELVEVGDSLSVVGELSTTNRGDPRTTGRPQGVEALVAVGTAVCADAMVTRREEDTYTTGSDLHEFVADTVEVVSSVAVLRTTVYSSQSESQKKKNIIGVGCVEYLQLTETAEGGLELEVK